MTESADCQLIGRWRIIEADLRPGVGDCKYRITTAGLDEYLLTAEEFATAITGASPDV